MKKCLSKKRLAVSSQGAQSKEKDVWDKLQAIVALISSIAIPLGVLLIAHRFDEKNREQDTSAKRVELALKVLEDAPKQNADLRAWAISVVNDYAHLSPLAKQQLQISPLQQQPLRQVSLLEGLPGVHTWRLSINGVTANAVISNCNMLLTGPVTTITFAISKDGAQDELKGIVNTATLASRIYLNGVQMPHASLIFGRAMMSTTPAQIVKFVFDQNGERQEYRLEGQ